MIPHSNQPARREPSDKLCLQSHCSTKTKPSIRNHRNSSSPSGMSSGCLAFRMAPSLLGGQSPTRPPRLPFCHELGYEARARTQMAVEHSQYPSPRDLRVMVCRTLPLARQEPTPLGQRPPHYPWALPEHPLRPLPLKKNRSYVNPWKRCQRECGRSRPTILNAKTVKKKPKPRG